jgi:hypothetical protein
MAHKRPPFSLPNLYKQPKEIPFPFIILQNNNLCKYERVNSLCIWRRYSSIHFLPRQDRGEWRALQPGRFTYGETVPITFQIGIKVVPRAGLGIWRRGKSLAFSGNKLKIPRSCRVSTFA